MKPLIIEAAINGGSTKARNAHTPISPEEVAADAIACIDAGAAIIHSHIEDIDCKGAKAAQRYREAYKLALDQRPDAILYATGTRGGEIAAKYEHVALLADCTRMGFLDPGSVNLASTGADGLPGARQFVYQNTFADIDHMIGVLARAKLGPNISIYEPGWLRLVLAYQRAGKLPQGAFVKFYFGGSRNWLDGALGGVSFGLPPTARALDAYLEMMADSELPWAVATPGDDVTAVGLTDLAIGRGGHVRVGLEDYRAERTPSNVALVEEVVARARALGRELADAKMAANLLGLPARATSQSRSART
jgi:uncharacterized protein (DUF849 family)